MLLFEHTFALGDRNNSLLVFSFLSLQPPLPQQLLKFKYLGVFVAPPYVLTHADNKPEMYSFFLFFFSSEIVLISEARPSGSFVSFFMGYERSNGGQEGSDTMCRIGEVC